MGHLTVILTDFANSIQSVTNVQVHSAPLALLLLLVVRRQDAAFNKRLVMNELDDSPPSMHSLDCWLVF
jgi:hypothetical protein